MFKLKLLTYRGSSGCLLGGGGGGPEECKFGRYCGHLWGKFSLCSERHEERVNIAQC